ncbi:ABC transporter ATP-binding protein [Nonomuraea sp. PA05]|uniref:ABC transporter ATP-binding protein n=1 Tax=Nonomuraea sp. PA05 TaxID=2604466 RepID=UPI0011D767F7|nr:ABC transporter ATP-binding protein [Nonomuraea sp. PA05]TYB57396.1 ABC transporter ATP-binding protein [Nonomuraea sp. PA05]
MQETLPRRATTTSAVRLDGVRKHFRRADRTLAAAVDGVSLEVAPAEILVLLGPSGCGKTTLLRSIAGLERPDAGLVEIGGRTVFDAARGLDVPPERRGLSMMFQSYALWPHLSVFDNVAYPLLSRRGGRPPKSEVAAQVGQALELVGIPELARQHPGELSGGQQQRVALARALVAGDGLILFDEPLSNVDAKVRERLRVELLAMQRRLGFAAVYVTHDQTEAMELATRIAVMRDGRVEQLGPPREIYDRPATRYVANFVGIANEIPGEVASMRDGRAVLRTPHGPLTGDAGPLTGAIGPLTGAIGPLTGAIGPLTGVAGPGLEEGAAAVAVWRPEHGRMSADQPDEPNRWRARRRVSMFAGPHVEHHLDAGGLACRLWSGSGGAGEEQEVWLSVPPGRLLILPA